MRQDKNFKISKQTKRFMAGRLCKNPNELKKLMIESQLYSAIVPKTSKGKKSEDKDE